TSGKLTTTDWSCSRIIAKLPVNPSCRAASSVRQRLGGRSRVNLLHAASAAGQASVHWSRRVSIGSVGGTRDFIDYLSATSTTEWVNREVTASVVLFAAALVNSPSGGNSNRAPSIATREPSKCNPTGRGDSRLAASNSPTVARWNVAPNASAVSNQHS